MKRLLTAALAAVMLLTLVVGVTSCKKDDGTPEGMQNVAIADAPFALYVPSDWISQASSGISGARASNTDTSNVTVTMYMPDVDMDAATYWQEKCLPEYTPAEGHVGLPEFAVIEEGTDTTLGGVNAKKYVFTFKMDGVKYQLMQIIAVEGSMVYTLQYHATETNYPLHADVADNIRSEFRFR